VDEIDHHCVAHQKLSQGIRIAGVARNDFHARRAHRAPVHERPHAVALPSRPLQGAAADESGGTEDN
jgi:hypothetical protein